MTEKTPIDYHKYQRDSKEPNNVLVSNRHVVFLAKSLDMYANCYMQKQDYIKAEGLLKLAITITKASGRNSNDLEKYQTKYAALLKETSKQDEEQLNPKANHLNQ